MSAAASARRRGGVLAFAGIVLIAISLRTAVSSISPIVDDIRSDIGLSTLVVSVIGALPPFAFAASGLLVPLVVRRAGLERALLGAIALIVLGHLARTLAPGEGVLLAASVVILAGIGAANVLVPPLVRRFFPHRVGAVTALYAAILSVSTAVPAWVAVPVADTAGWRVSLAVWFAVAVLAAPPWIALLAGRRRAELAEVEAAATAEIEQVEAAPRGVHRSRTAVAIALVFGTSSTAVYVGVAWLPQLLVDLAGVSRAEAGSMLAVFAAAGIPGSFLVPMLAARLRSVLPIVLVCVAFLLLGAGGLLLAPAAAPWVWVLVYGLGPSLFPLALYLIPTRARTALGGVALSGFAQGVGYIVGGLGPLVVGLLHDATGGWTASLIYLLVIALPAVPAAMLLRRPTYVEDDLARRAG